MVETIRFRTNSERFNSWMGDGMAQRSPCGALTACRLSISCSQPVGSLATQSCLYLAGSSCARDRAPLQSCHTLPLLLLLLLLLATLCHAYSARHWFTPFSPRLSLAYGTRGLSLLGHVESRRGARAQQPRTLEVQQEDHSPPRFLQYQQDGVPRE